MLASLCCAAAAWAAAPNAQAQAPKPAAAAATTVDKPAARAPSRAGYTELKWEELVPRDWDPSKRFRDKKLLGLSDADPRTAEMMRELRQEWDNAPTRAELDGAAVKLPGYLVPLEESDGAISEFLLVPYFGACIHSPPPPANQIVHVLAAKPVKGLRSMDAAWVSGTLRTRRQDSTMGVSGYHIEARLVEKYVTPSR
jgi:hypothetical protein